MDLITASQLSEYCQIYAFQRETAAAEQQLPIPAPRLPSAMTGAGRQTLDAKHSGHQSRSREHVPHTPQVTHVISEHTAPSDGHHHQTSFRPGNGQMHHFAGHNGSLSYAGEEPKKETKVRTVFDHLDVNHNRYFELDAFRRTFKAVNITFSSATIQDLFARGDTDKDGCITFPEFQNWGENYPSVLDALFFRGREKLYQNRRMQELERQQMSVDEAQRKERHANTQVEHALKELVAQQNAVRAAEENFQARMHGEDERRKQLQDAVNLVQESRDERHRKERDVINYREGGKPLEAGVIETQKAVAAAENRVASQEDAVHQLKERERQIESMLLEARRNTQRGAEALSELQDELVEIREKEQHALQQWNDHQRELTKLAELLAQADHDLARCAEALHDAEANLADAETVTRQAALRRDEEEREVEGCHEVVDRAKVVHNQTIANIDELNRTMRELEADYADYLAKRRQLEEAEQPLLEQEVRL